MSDAFKWSWRCFFGIHHWPKWGETVEREMEGLITGKTTRLVQERTCVRCNKFQFHIPTVK